MPLGMIATSNSWRRFFFEGFLPASGRLRREALERIQSELAPVVLYESRVCLGGGIIS